MKNETPGAGQKPSQQTDLRMENGPLRAEDIEGMSPDQLDGKIRKAIAELNAALGDIDPQKVREAFRDEDPKVTRETLIGDLDGLEDRLRSRLETAGSVESLEQRQSRLGQFVEAHFADICPPECRMLATEKCIHFEDGCRSLFDEPRLELGEEDAEDPELREKISSRVLAKVEDINRNEAIIVGLAADRDKLDLEKAETEATKDQAIAELKVLQRANPAIPSDETERSQMLRSLTKNNDSVLRPRMKQAETVAERSENTRDGEQLREAQKSADLDSIKKLQGEFDQLRAEKGTIGALRTLLEPGRLKSPEMKAKVQSAINMAQSLVNAIPGKSAVVSQILDRSSINFGAANPIAVFAGFLAEADRCSDLTDEEKQVIRRVLGQSEKDFNTGSDAQKIAKSREQIIDPETGKVIKEKYIHGSPETMAELRPNLGTYMHGERMMLATKDGLIAKDVTSWTSEDIGMLAEVMDFHRFAEQCGVTGFVETIANIHFNALQSGAFDRARMIRTRRTISALVGMGEGYDGDVFNPDEKAVLLSNQMRALTEDDQVIQWHNDEVASTDLLKQLGFRDKNGNPNIDIIKAFGSYSQQNIDKKINKADVHAHLHELFPELVQAPGTDEEGQLAA